MTWAFGGVSFAVVSSDSIEEEWFRRKVERTVDAVAGSDPPIIYVDIGATTYEPMALTAQFTSKTTRSTLEALLGQSGTLTDDDGRSCSARLVGAVPLRVIKRGSGTYRLAVEFEYVSA